MGCPGCSRQDRGLQMRGSSMKRRAYAVIGVAVFALAALGGCRGGSRGELAGSRSPAEAARLAEYQKAAQANPRNPRLYVDWGSGLARTRDFKGAIARYQQALALDPRNAAAY